MTLRQEKLNAVLQEVIARFLHDVFGAAPLVTVTVVMVSADMRNAKALISVFPEKETPKVIKTLERKHGALGRYLAAHTRMKYIPVVLFEIDRGEENRRRIEELLKER